MWFQAIDNNNENCLVVKDVAQLQDVDPSVYGGNLYCQVYETVCTTPSQEVALESAINLVYQSVYVTIKDDGSITGGDVTTQFVFLVTV